jgi:hypothetical protein
MVRSHGPIRQNRIVLENGSMTSMVDPFEETLSMPGFIRGSPVTRGSLVVAVTPLTGIHTVESGAPSPCVFGGVQDKLITARTHVGGDCVVEAVFQSRNPSC